MDQMQSQEPHERRADLVRWQEHVDRRLDKQDKALGAIKTGLDTHIETTGNWKEELKPVLDAYISMESGVRAIGKFSDFVAWCGKKVAFLAVIFTSIVGAIIAWRQLK